MRRIRYKTFLRAALRFCRTLSRTWRPVRGAVALKYATRTASLYGRHLYVARVVDAAGKKILPWDSMSGRAVTLFEFASRFGADVVRRRRRLGMPKRVQVFLLTCSGCDRSVIIDGNHRMMRLATKLVDVPAVVYELKGKGWPEDAPDVGVLCRC